ncbi:L,D-transpeptidase [Pannus brasiliensis CCIBt3594]|uniref:L,D-transpeptidase n=1 Tax=Pannus brasiliensis CCIBt3594 TaxID=1427578 RepID=A0AAW9QLV5_9CHRO
MLSKRVFTLLAVGWGCVLPIFAVPLAGTADEMTTIAPTPAETNNLATHLILKLKERKVYVYRDDKVLHKFTVAVGKKGWETPTGKFQVRELVRNPVWTNPWTGQTTPPGPNSALGERWIGFWTDGKNSIGFHGTPTVNSLGKAASHGCVRMRNSDVKVLFDLVQMGTPVIVQP